MSRATSICILIFSLISALSLCLPHSEAKEVLASLSEQERLVWTDPDSCWKTVESGSRLAEVQEDRVRVASWNIRWFPIGELEADPDNAHEPTDLSWLACVLTWLNADIFVLQELLATEEAQQAWDRILPQLNKGTGGTWELVLEACGYEDSHHVGFLWNRQRVRLSDHQALWQLNPKAKSEKRPCAKGFRPGRYAYVQSRNSGGIDFHLTGLHLKSGPTVFALEDRQQTINRLDRAFRDKVEKDADILVLGDFNTIGAGDWQSQKRELKYLRRFVRNEKPGFLDLPVNPACTEYFRGRGSWLDHVLVSKAMKEVAVRSVRVTGYCRLLNCQRTRKAMPLAYRRLSDHCPIVLELVNRDMD